ncbi:MAG TPA: dynamin family protein [Bryobacteraceae bacterium]|nr:dynamin family protein [Bryobacteraceae bacterium]
MISSPPNRSCPAKPTQDTIALAADIIDRYAIASLRPVLRTCRALQAEPFVRIAILGRFKAGKSTFLNDLLGRDLLPVGVVPVTAVVTEIAYAPQEIMTVKFLDGTHETIPATAISWYITESENPENRKQVALVTIHLPSLERFRNIRFIDTPGLDSVFAHNTETSLSWLPHVGLALVAIGVDPPLSEKDVALIRSLYEYTPHVAVLLTKTDTLTSGECCQVEEFVNEQLQRQFVPAPSVFPYSARPGNEELKRNVQSNLILPAQARFRDMQCSIRDRKLRTLLQQCDDYLTLALKSAAALDDERHALNQVVLGERSFIEETKLQLRLIAKHAMGAARRTIEKELDVEDKSILHRLSPELERGYTAWTRNLSSVISAFQTWLDDSLGRELRHISSKKRKALLGPMESVQGQLTRSLQDFQRRLSERTMRAFGVPLRITEMSIDVEEPCSPDVHIGRVFDHNWELLGVLVPMWLVGGWVRRHLINRRLPYEVFKNLSRFTSQWEENVNGSIIALQQQADAQLEELMTTVENLLSHNRLEAPLIQQDLESIRAAEVALRECACHEE